MPLPLILAAVALVVGGLVGAQLFTWKVYARGSVAGNTFDVGAGPTSFGWVPLALAAGAAFLLLRA